MSFMAATYDKSGRQATINFDNYLHRLLRGIRKRLEVRQLEKMAEREGFEPSVPFGTPAFQASTFDRSVTSPRNGRQSRRSRIIAPALSLARLKLAVFVLSRRTAAVNYPT
jgi:hypothetical protein